VRDFHVQTKKGYEKGKLQGENGVRERITGGQCICDALQGLVTYPDDSGDNLPAGKLGLKNKGARWRGRDVAGNWGTAVSVSTQPELKAKLKKCV